MTEETKNNLMHALTISADLLNTAHRIAADTSINEFTRKEILEDATNFVNFVHAAIQEQLNYTETV